MSVWGDHGHDRGWLHWRICLAFARYRERRLIWQLSLDPDPDVADDLWRSLEIVRYRRQRPEIARP